MFPVLARQLHAHTAVNWAGANELEPAIVVYMPDESAEAENGSTVFRRIQDVMLEGGFRTWDLGQIA